MVNSLKIDFLYSLILLNVGALSMLAKALNSLDSIK